jgi:DNA invertase Pin-like site-specific DNA recombinase
MHPVETYDVERDLIRTRTAEGRSRAQKLGQRMGRPSLGHHKFEAIERDRTLLRPGGGTMGLYHLTERGTRLTHNDLSS